MINHIKFCKIAAILTVATSLFVLSSCSSKNIIDDKKAVSVFADENLIKVDESLANIKIETPEQVKNKSWFGNNSDNNQKIENFAFAGKISKTKSIWASYRFGFDNKMVFAPVVADNVIYILNEEGKLYARNLDNYKLIWKKELVKGWFVKNNFSNGKISYFKGKIFVSSGYNEVFSIDAKSGDIIWKKTIGSIAISTPISDGQQVFITTNDNKTYSLSSKNGEINWVHSGILKATGILGSANPVIYKNYLLSSYSSGEVYLLDRKSGNAAWVYDLNLNRANTSDFVLNDVDSTPVVKNGVAYAIGNGGLMMAIRINDGVILWQKELASIADFWIAGDFIYLINNSNQLICLYSKTGSIKWISNFKNYKNDKKPATHIVYNGVIMAGGNLIMTNQDEKLLVVSPIDGKVIQTKKLGQRIYHNPIAVNGKIYLHTIGTFTTNLVVIK